MTLRNLLIASVLAIGLAATNGFGQIVINELQAENKSSIQNGDDFPDWIELYNAAETNVNIGGYILREVQDKGGGTQTNTFIFPAGSVLTAGQKRVIWFDNETNSPGTHTRYGLPKEGTWLRLLTPLGGLVDQITFGFQLEDLTIARIPDGPGGVWQLALPSPGSNNIAFPFPIDSWTNTVKINEWTATNAPPNTNEWLELYNTSTNVVSMTGMLIADLWNSSNNVAATKFVPMTNFSYLAGNGFQRLWAVDHSEPNDELNFNLGSSDGDTVRLYLANRTNWFEEISFPGNNQVPGYWDGRSSRGRLPDGGPIYADRFLNPTPSDSNFQLMTNVIVNEVLTHTDPPYEDAIELYNTTEQPVDISNWWISNQQNTPKKFRIPEGTIIPPKGYRVFYEMLGVATLPKPGFNTSGEVDPGDFTLNSAHGDQVWLFSGSNDVSGTLTGLRGSLDFPAIDNGVSMGPLTNSVGEREVVPLLAKTFGINNPANVAAFRQGQGAPNAGPRYGSLVISEIYYHPPPYRQGTNILDNDQDEFVEVYNAGTTNIQLYDPVNYGAAGDGRTNTWRLRGLVDEDFPTNMVMKPGDFAIFVNFNPQTNLLQLTNFYARFKIPPTFTNIFGPYSSDLDNGEGELVLRRPDPPQTRTNDFGFVPYIQVDRVEYDDGSGWPSLPDGATNFAATAALPAHLNFPAIGYSLERVRVENYGDDPRNWRSATPSPGQQPVKIDEVMQDGENITLRFFGWAGSSYTALVSGSLDGPWVPIQTFPRQATSGNRFVFDINYGDPAVFYRITSP